MNFSDEERLSFFQLYENISFFVFFVFFILVSFSFCNLFLSKLRDLRVKFPADTQVLW